MSINITNYPNYNNYQNQANCSNQNVNEIAINKIKIAINSLLKKMQDEDNMYVLKLKSVS